MNKFIDFKLFEFAGNVYHVSTLIALFILIAMAVLIQLIIRKGIYRIKEIEISKKYAIFKLTQYVLWILVILIALQLLKFNISVLLAGSAALLVGVGLGMQQVFGDFVSGVFLLLDRTIKVGDVIEVNGMVCRVNEIRFRTTTVTGRDENYIILPNSYLTKNEVINWTHNKVSSRFKIQVGVDYSSDVRRVIETLKETVKLHPAVLKDPEVSVRFSDFADSSLQFQVVFWSDEVFRIEKIKSDIRVMIFEAFQKHDIKIPFPQRVVHIPQP